MTAAHALAVSLIVLMVVVVGGSLLRSALADARAYRRRVTSGAVRLRDDWDDWMGT